jgi:hypothetical protein
VETHAASYGYVAKDRRTVAEAFDDYINRSSRAQ